MFTCTYVRVYMCSYIHMITCTQLLTCSHVHLYICPCVMYSRDTITQVHITCLHMCTLLTLPTISPTPRHACAHIASAYVHVVYERTCSNTPSIICTGSHPLHPLTNNTTKRERGVGTGGSQYPMTPYPSLHAISHSPSSPATSGRPQHHLTVCVQGPLNPTTPRGC